jgi:tetratricopeptide (TPR) repeat protein
MDVIRQESTPDRLQARGDSAAALGDLTRAEQYFDAAMSAGGDERALTKRLLMVCSADSRFPAAAKYGEDYLRKHPGDTEVRFAVATVYIALGESARARVELEQVVTERPEIAEAHYALADVLRHEGDAPLEADAQYREYIRLSPTGPYAEAARSLLLRSVP